MSEEAIIMVLMLNTTAAKDIFMMKEEKFFCERNAILRTKKRSMFNYSILCEDNNGDFRSMILDFRIKCKQVSACISILPFFLFLFVFVSCNAPAQGQLKQAKKPNTSAKPATYVGIVTGAERTAQYFPLLKNKRVALMVNHTSLINKTHIVDSLLSLGIEVKVIFAPEHGFRGTADAGDHINDGKDPKTKLPIVSLYGAKLKPSKEDLQDVDVVIFDIQDVGARFYTYISSMHYLMIACAENKLPMIVLDRPNPNIYRIDGPVMQTKFQSFVGMHPIPVLHGLTVGELAKMIVGEKWLGENIAPELTVITCENYTRTSRYSLPVKPSPNLPNDRAVYLYPSICFFEGTDISVARGTDFPFQAIGSPQVAKAPFVFTPKPTQGAMNPPHKDVECKGYDLRNESKDFGVETDKLNLQYLFKMYALHKDQQNFFLKTGSFNKLAGNSELKLQIETELSEEDIRKTWQKDIDAFIEKRKPYLIYN